MHIPTFVKNYPAVGIIGAQIEECFFWATHAGAELDLLIVQGNYRNGFEIKRTTSPTITPSIRNALSDLHLHTINVIHSGDHTFQLSDKVRAISINNLLTDLKQIPYY